jgi:hypothetical protein
MDKKHEFINDTVKALDLLVVSLDRIGGCEEQAVGDELLKFLTSRDILATLANLRSKAWRMAEENLSNVELEGLEEELHHLPYWSSR